jgi:hypothetical protein
MPALKLIQSNVTKTIISLFATKPEMVTWATLSAATSLPRERIRGSVATALRWVLKNHGAVYENLRDVGYRRVENNGLADVGERAIEKGRRIHRRGGKKMRTANLGKLTADERSRHIVHETILEVLVQTASSSTRKKASQAAQRAHNQPDVAQVELIRGALAPKLRIVK